MSEILLAAGVAPLLSQARTKTLMPSSPNRYDAMRCVVGLVLLATLIAGLSIASNTASHNPSPSKDIAMLTLPKIVEKPQTAYYALKRAVTLPFDDEIPAIIDALMASLEGQGAEPTGPIFFKHNLIDMPHIEMEFGVPVDKTLPAQGDFVSAILPAGRYAEITHDGPYDDLIEVNGVLIDWVRQAGHIFDARPEGRWEWFANRAEIYLTDPENRDGKMAGRTTVSIKLKDA